MVLSKVSMLQVAGIAIVLSSSTHAGTSSDNGCDRIYQAVLDVEKFPSVERKISYLKDHGRSCEGTGLYESRLAYFYLQNKNFAAATKVLNDGLSKPNQYHQNLKYSLIDIDVMDGRLEQGFENALKLKEQYPAWYGAYFLLAKVTLMQGRFQESIGYAIESNKRQPDASAYLGIGVANHHLHRDELAIDAVLAAIKLDPSVLEAGAGINEAVYSMVRLTRYDDAVKLARSRMQVDAKWNDDKVFVKAVDYLESKGYSTR